MTETSIDALFEEINELKQKNKELKRENQTLKLKYKNECLLNENKRLKCEDVFDSFIRGQESEKRINPKNKEYQERIDYTLKHSKQNETIHGTTPKYYSQNLKKTKKKNIRKKMS